MVIQLLTRPFFYFPIDWPTDFRRKERREQLDNRVVEVVWDSTRQTWKILRFRDDKKNGNYRAVVFSILDSIRDGVEAAEVSYILIRLLHGVDWEPCQHVIVSLHYCPADQAVAPDPPGMESPGAGAELGQQIATPSSAGNQSQTKCYQIATPSPARNQFQTKCHQIATSNVQPFSQQVIARVSASTPTSLVWRFSQARPPSYRGCQCRRW